MPLTDSHSQGRVLLFLFKAKWEKGERRGEKDVQAKNLIIPGRKCLKTSERKKCKQFCPSAR